MPQLPSTIFVLMPIIIIEGREMVFFFATTT